MFDDATRNAFSLRFPTLSEAEVREAADWVDALNRRESLHNPSAMLESILHKRASAKFVHDAGQYSQPSPTAAVSDRSRSTWGTHADPDIAYRELAKIRELLEYGSTSVVDPQA